MGQENTSIIKYGMNIVGRSLGHIRRGDFEGLKNKITDKIKSKFNVNLEGKKSLVEILEKAGDSLSESWFLSYRLKDAEKIFNYLDLTDKAKKTLKRYQEGYKKRNEIAKNLEMYNGYDYIQDI